MEYELGIVVACFPALRALMKYRAGDARSRDDEGKLGNNQSLDPALSLKTGRGMDMERFHMAVGTK